MAESASALCPMSSAPAASIVDASSRRMIVESSMTYTRSGLGSSYMADPKQHPACKIDAEAARPPVRYESGGRDPQVL
jgi:hypothetical protein